MLLKGVVIDWGVIGDKYRDYTLAKREAADSVRVWTTHNIEIWPITEVTAEEAV